MIFDLLAKIDTKYPFDQAVAHCDIPCKIYDPITAQLAVLTMIRMVDLLNELKDCESLTLEQQATFIRLVNEKEAHGNKVKEEILIIWGDYIKQPQLDSHQNLHALTHEIMLAASKAKQSINREASVKLLDKVNQFVEIFWETKGVEVYRAICPYPPAESLSYPVLKSI
ncbi:superoxide dismutase, Ni [Colwellia sp. 1_MG-2023]|uniref:superoxide dismutase, Ni n=1 Tax=unclassified Colwellia TaxID=196834 RepID=UPI001C090C25|nr:MULTISPECIES: superoxide dismutase, Ni [unclassified Colwellia]MBU2924629.1 superoxide dismutase, Ni [Colwellia sp. C2M11]MDO6653885.1 superoxide dismutase, Ni [Colwellia sp. 3_MG-2023]MDO6666712.1 superoxide dismutase, Ni [Colwellia sp. 2_MG-2023]MDO6691153.1 superoxide dismutase, Ni [Colwellia sp. 1_MG-2023]